MSLAREFVIEQPPIIVSQIIDELEKNPNSEFSKQLAAARSFIAALKQEEHIRFERLIISLQKKEEEFEQKLISEQELSREIQQAIAEFTKICGKAIVENKAEPASTTPNRVDLELARIAWTVNKISTLTQKIQGQVAKQAAANTELAKIRSEYFTEMVTELAEQYKLEFTPEQKEVFDEQTKSKPLELSLKNNPVIQQIIMEKTKIILDSKLTDEERKLKKTTTQ